MRKYIVMDNGGPLQNCEFAVIFNETESHLKMAEALGGKDHVLGAGGFSVGIALRGEMAVSCYGKSVSLKKSSRGVEDAFTVALALFGTTDGIDIS